MSKWIQKATKNKGALHKALGVPINKNIPLNELQKAAKRKGKVGEEARLALTLRHLHPKK